MLSIPYSWLCFEEPCLPTCCGCPIALSIRTSESKSSHSEAAKDVLIIPIMELHTESSGHVVSVLL